MRSFTYKGKAPRKCNEEHGQHHDGPDLRANDWAGDACLDYLHRYLVFPLHLRRLGGSDLDLELV